MPRLNRPRVARGLVTVPRLTVVGDLSAAGGFRAPLGPWYRTDVPADAAASALSMVPSAAMSPRVRMLRAGSVVGITASVSAAIVSGTITLAVYKDGNPVAGATMQLTTGTNNSTTWAKDTYTFAAGEALSIWLTSSSLNPAGTNDITAWLEIEE